MTATTRIEERLARAEAEKAAKARATVQPGAAHRSGLRAKAAIAAVIREALSRAGADPAACRALRMAEAAAAELAAIPDTPALRRADKRLLAGDAGETSVAAAEAFDAKMADLVSRYRSGRLDTPDFASESMANVLAWSIAALSDDPRRRGGLAPRARAWNSPGVGGGSSGRNGSCASSLLASRPLANR